MWLKHAREEANTLRRKVVVLEREVLELKMKLQLTQGELDNTCSQI